MEEEQKGSGDPDSNQLEPSAVKIKLYGRQTQEESKVQAKHFLSFKQHMRFKLTPYLHQYQLMDVIGKGEFGTVKSAIHLKSEMPCAIKIISKDGLGTEKQKELN